MNHGICINCGWWSRITDTIGTCNISPLYNDYPIITYCDDYCTDYINRKKFNNNHH